MNKQKVKEIKLEIFTQDLPVTRQELYIDDKRFPFIILTIGSKKYLLPKYQLEEISTVGLESGDYDSTTVGIEVLTNFLTPTKAGEVTEREEVEVFRKRLDWLIESVEKGIANKEGFKDMFIAEIYKLVSHPHPDTGEEKK